MKLFFAFNISLLLIVIGCGARSQDSALTDFYKKPVTFTPYNLTGDATTITQIDLKWECSDSSGYVIERKTSGNEFTQIGTSTTKSYKDIDIEPYNRYTYRVASKSNDTISGYSNEVTISSHLSLDKLKFGSSATLDIISWNVQHFPKDSTTTVDHLVDFITQMKPDIIAMQEMEDDTAFNSLMESLEGYDYIRSHNVAYNINLAILYRTEEITFVDAKEIFPNDILSFPRPPIILEFKWQGAVPFVIIDNHLKCCGDGIIDESSSTDEENRRLTANNKLDQYIKNNYPDSSVIVAGDWNDSLTDEYNKNVFNMFIDHPDEYMFADMDIAEGPSTEWSYPSWPSHLDHILITNELFDTFNNPYMEIKVLKLQQYLTNGFTQYDEEISDHLPLSLKLMPYLE